MTERPGATVVVTCPTSRFQDTGEPHTVIGCGSTNGAGPDRDGFHDCRDCGMWFMPEVLAVGVDAVDDDDDDGDEIPPGVVDRIVQRTAAAVNHAGNTLEKTPGPTAGNCAP